MQAFDNGSYFTVTVTRREIEAFAARWPCSGMRSPRRALTFQFEKRNGDLVDLTGEAPGYDEGAVSALADHAKEYGRRRLGIPA